MRTSARREKNRGREGESSEEWPALEDHGEEGEEDLEVAGEEGRPAGDLVICRQVGEREESFYFDIFFQRTWEAARSS